MMNEQNFSDNSSDENSPTNVYENNQEPNSNKNIHSTQVKNRHSLPNLNIKHPYYSINDDKDPFIDETKIITDEHVKITHVPRSSTHNLNTGLLVPKSDADSRRKSTDDAYGSRPNKILSQKVHHTSKDDNINQDINNKTTATKSMVKRVSLTNELPRKMSSTEDVHVHVKHITVTKKK